MSWRDVVSNNKLLSFLLDTPSEHWVVVRGIHFHKSFWGSLLAFVGIFVLTIHKVTLIGAVIIVIGFVYIFLSVLGHIYTHNKPYFKLWDKK